MSGHRFNILLASVFGAAMLITAARGFYVIYIEKNYPYLVEVSCNPGKEECIQRDCSNADDCPPNQLQFYKEFTLSAKDFLQCEGTCEEFCAQNPESCRQTDCSSDALNTCIGPENKSI